MRIEERDGGFDLWLGDTLILRHRPDHPCVAIGAGTPRIEMHQGNFAIEDTLSERVELRHVDIDGDRITLAAGPGATPRLVITLSPGALELSAPRPANRLWLRIAADAGEHVWGGGEQMSYLDLRGRRFPLWTSEPGVGRDPATAITRQAGPAGGDYWTTNYPQPTWISSRRYALHVDTTAYAVFDFRAPDHHTIDVWEVPARIELWARPTLIDLVHAMSDRFGRPPPLPDWVFNGAIIGLKDGERSFERMDRMLDAGVRVSALWCEDWCGLRHTSFGARLFWDWRHDPARYPDLPGRIAALRARGIRFMGYANPYLCHDGALFAEADAAGFFARDNAGRTALVDFGEFLCGVVDLTQPGARAWFAERVLRREMLDLGLSGWMADFGEYLPTDIHLAHGEALLQHNAWPVLWAGVNAAATAGTDALFFMRAGYTGVQRHCPLLWAGDQCVDFSRHDGIGTTITAALSAGLVGNAVSHSDIGGYTSLFGLVRTRELLMRWIDLAAFTPVMRTHEGNRPRDNLQVDDDPDVLAHFARMTQVWVHLAPYLRHTLASGLPAQRPLFLHFEDDPRTATIQDQYLYGPDLLVAPVLHAGVTTRDVYLPGPDRWIHLWSGTAHPSGQTTTVVAPIGEPPVFLRPGSPFADLFDALMHKTAPPRRRGDRG